MSMSTSSAALTTAQRKLKNLASDAISIPDAAELYQRKLAELADAKRRLAEIVSRQIKLESSTSTNWPAYQSIVAEKTAAEALVARLENEGGVLKAALIAQRPKPPLSPRQQMMADAYNAAASFDPYHRCKRGTPEKIAEAQKAVDELVLEYRLNQPSGNAREAWTAKSNAARTRLAALQGPPWPAYMPWASRETLKAVRKAEGLE